MHYECDACGRACSRLHQCETFAGDAAVCDDCYDYDWEAYDEPADPLLHPELIPAPAPTDR